MKTAKPVWNLTAAGRGYVGAVAAVGITLLFHSIATMSAGRLTLQWFVLAGLTLLSGSFTVRVPTIPARLSVSETFVFAAAMLFGPAAATVLVVLDSLVISVWQPKMSRRWLRVLFNMSAPAIAIWVAAHAFFFLADKPPLHDAPEPILSLLVPLLAMAVVYFLLNSWLIAFAVAFEKHTSALLVWRQNFLWLSLNFFSGASVAALLLPYLQEPEQSFFRVAGILLPLLLISYLTYKTALGRVEDANRHLSELNQLYLSTIETLAMAIDAKDQITHGHIRRVQHYAVALAQRVGITDPLQIRAIEAASLLHDMGKLAVPEYILNKPGRLTPAEFDRMKVHASVGADILSAINFPYPVVPIVRHHHENWDGSGYPDGLRGGDIPIGARILSVVDCFDALTSDRPYRPRLSDSEALRILRERRGVMYDPLIVDTFVGSYHELAVHETLERVPVQDFGRGTIEPNTSSGHPLENITASSEEMLVLYDLARTLTGIEPANAVEAVFNQTRRVLPLSACVFFQYDSASDCLTATSAAGENSHSFLGLRTFRGQRLTGWVAANRQTILNSDPALDLGEVARRMKPRLRSCISSPIILGDSLLGVLTGYSTYDEAFREDHRRIFEGVTRQVAGILSHLNEQAESETRALSVIPQAREEDLRRIFDAFVHKGSLSVLYVDHVQDIGSPVRDALFTNVSVAMKRNFSNREFIFRFGETSVVAIVPGLEPATAVQITSQLEHAISMLENEGTARSKSVRVGVACAPRDGSTFEILFRAARERSRSTAADSGMTNPRQVH
jgi:putative nucleotidyltransferase with HDIG domain